jgi:hypothetical protein
MDCFTYPTSLHEIDLSIHRAVDVQNWGVLQIGIFGVFYISYGS